MNALAKVSNVIVHPKANTALARLCGEVRDLAVAELTNDQQLGPKFFGASNKNPALSELTQRLLDAALALSRADHAARLALDYLDGSAPKSLLEVVSALTRLLNTGIDAADKPTPGGGGTPANDNVIVPIATTPTKAVSPPTILG